MSSDAAGARLAAGAAASLDPVEPAADAAIEVSGLSKFYPIFERPSHRLLQMLWRGRRRYYREFHALDDVSFSVRRGATLGIVGRNGAGKSTLLQLICGTLTPSAGRVRVNGRVAALLELGAGFNPEFTGRENVVINAAILGLTPAEVDARLDAIFAFADIGEFVDQPVKTYSSGMYVRLAFSVAIHVSPDILVVDEALSVGDAFFQAKCMARIRRMLDDGVTLLFISHDIAAVKAICSEVLWLDHGRVRAHARHRRHAQQQRGREHGSAAREALGEHRRAPRQHRGGREQVAVGRGHQPERDQRQQRDEHGGTEQRGCRQRVRQAPGTRGEHRDRRPDGCRP